MSLKSKKRSKKTSKKRFFLGETGQTLTEYVLILAIVFMVAMRVKKELMGSLTNATSTMGQKINTMVGDIEE